MSRIAIDFDPLDITTQDVGAVRKTMARLVIRVDGAAVTHVFDKRARTTRESLTTSLYPIAEWLLANWWFLWHETWTPGRSSVNRRFEERHSLRFAGDGFAFPDVQFVPEGRFVHLRWNARSTKNQNVDFLSHGSTRIETEDLKTAIEQFILGVLERLDAVGVGSTWLHEEWAAIQKVASSESESRFCRQAAEAGIDPFSASDADAERLERAAEGLEESMQDDFFKAVELPELDTMRSWVDSSLQAANSWQGDSTAAAYWARRRNDFRALNSASPPNWEPWQWGYASARALRGIVSLPSDRPVGNSLEGVDFPFIDVAAPPLRSIEAIVAPRSSATAPVCVTNRTESASRRFVFFRGLFNYLQDETPTARLITSSQTFRQQAGRAFAAEFLAPAAVLKQMLPSTEVVNEDVSGLAAFLGVSEFVIRHQIENHGLGVLADPYL